MSVLEVEEFLDDKRTHMVEGIIVGQVSISFLFLNLSLLSGGLLIHEIQYVPDVYVRKLESCGSWHCNSLCVLARQTMPCVQRCTIIW
jgi:hypothetical protein